MSTVYPSALSPDFGSASDHDSDYETENEDGEDYETDIEEEYEPNGESDNVPHTPQIQPGLIPVPPSSAPWASSPIKGTREEIKEIRKRKSQKRRRQTLDKKLKSKEEQDKTIRLSALDDTLSTLHSKNLKLWDLLEYIFNPVNQQGNIRYNEFFVKRGCPTQILEWWLSPQNRARKGKEEIREWISKYAARKASREARTITKSKEIQTANIVLDATTVKNFDLQKIHKMLAQEKIGAPFTMRVLEAFSTSRHSNRHTDNRRQKTNMVCSTSFLSFFPSR